MDVSVGAAITTGVSVGRTVAVGATGVSVAAGVGVLEQANEAITIALMPMITSQDDFI